MAKIDIYAMVTDRLIADLENGVIPWEKPWTGTADGAISGATGKPYSLINQWLLREPGRYYTFQQVKKQGGYVRKGEHGHTVVFWKVCVVKETQTDGTEKEKKVPVLRQFTVFHESQCEGLPVEPEKPVQTAEQNRDCEAVVTDYVKRSGVTFESVKSGEAYYSPVRDLVHVPLMGQFAKTAEYYSTVFHELTHSTGHKSRLNRIKTGVVAAFGGEDYSKEELVAEIGAAALCNMMGVESPSSFKNNTAYIQSWLKALKNDKRMIIHAASQAEKAVRLILGETETAEA